VQACERGPVFHGRGITVETLSCGVHRQRVLDLERGGTGLPREVTKQLVEERDDVR
jgi:hypothetical protein